MSVMGTNRTSLLAQELSTSEGEESIPLASGSPGGIIRFGKTIDMIMIVL
jgi:hypothetical protein